MKNILILTVIFLLALPLVFSAGTTRYPFSSGVNQDYANTGRGEFILIDGVFDYVRYGKNLVDSSATPIIDDFDNNSISEMVIVDDDVVKAYQNKELDIIGATVDIGSSPSHISNIISFDIDNDGFNEIIFLGVNTDGTKDEMFVLNFSQADGLQIQNQFLAGTSVLEPIVACRLPNECIATISSSSEVDNFNPFTHYFYGIAFDTTNKTSSDFVIYEETQASGDTIALCSPRDKHIAVDDYDGDGNIEYVLSMAKKESSGGGVIEWKIFWLDNTTVDMSASHTETVLELDTECNGVTGLASAFTSPLSKEVDDGEPRTEAVIGAQTSDDDFRIFIFSGSDGSKVDEFPEEWTTLEADGNIVSNVVYGNFIPSTSANDVCVMGFDSTENRYELLCGNVDKSPLSHDIYEYDFDLLGFNITGQQKEQHHLIHGVQFSNALTDGKDLLEILSTYGVFELNSDLTRIFNPETTRGVNLAVDLERVGQDDIVSMTENNIFYFDDKASNNPARFVWANGDYIDYNPCPINTIIKVNTTMQITAQARDTNTFAWGYDELNFNMFVYYGDTNQQNRTFRDIPTSDIDGTATITSSPLFAMNKTGSNKVIRIEVWDSNQTTDIDVVEQLFSVTAEGVEFGDITCRYTEIDDEDVILPDICVEDDDCPTGYNCLGDECELISKSLPALAGQEAEEVFNMSITILWIMFMLGLMLGIWFAPLDKHLNFMDSANARMGAIAVGEILMLILGTMFGYLPVAIIISLIILGLIAISVWLVNKFTGVTQ